MNNLLGGRYQLGEMIGTGGMADVYIADDTRLSRKVAVKVLRSDLAKDPSFVTRFRKEAFAAAGLNHPGIVAVYDSGEEPAPYIVMELVYGKTLREIIHSGERLPLSRVLEIAEGILSALEYSHERGIVHRDIKPGNVMITEMGDVKVMDFGIARALDDAGATLTNTWNIVGTAQYLSPEQASGEVADMRSDIYSTGCLLYELLTGRPPFTGDTPVSIAYQHVSGVLVLPSLVEPTLPPGVDVLLSVALSKKATDRYQSSGQMLDDIYKIRGGEEVTTRIPKVRRTNKLRFTIAIATAVVIAVAGTGLLLNRQVQTDSGVVVSNVVGLSEVQARALLKGFVVTVQHAHDPRIPKDLIANQLPLATSKAKPGSSVIITLSDGPGDAIVPPDLVGLTLMDARASLAAAGLVIAKTEAISSDKPQGTVLQVTPGPGTTIAAGSGVTLQIASGDVEVPELVGINAIQARTTLVQAGFLVKQIEASDSTQASGVVLAQAPSAGTVLTIGASVTITVNTP